jgi:SHS2 domain-containing protein
MASEPASRDASLLTSMSRPPFEILEHTADVGLRAFGETLAELFANAALGMMAVAFEGEAAPRQVRPEKSRKLAASGEDREELLVHYLSEILYALDAEGWRFSEFRIQRIESNEIEAEGWGNCEARTEHSRVAVKAVTYHQVSVTQTSEGWESVVYFDI